ncbi:MAG: ChrR family anti-sigma-E factor [Luminiphilus sp.]|jgi:putative transcriptional regulator|tara:strand:- start:234 stop:884 length:651 start_codon:yes stop_codon:yes gene_type:complete
MVKHHPDTNTLLEFAASSLPAAQSVVVSTHLQFCSECRQRLAQLESLGATMFENAEPVDINPSVFDNVLARLDEVEEDRAANDASASTLSWTVKQIRKGNLDQLQWKKVTRSLRIADLGEIDGAAEFSLYHIAEGGRIPQHNHSGTEMTLVLQGGFSDEGGSYHAGDFITREAGDIHAPTALSGGDCICLAVLESPLRFTSWHHRWLSPLLQLRAG